MKWKELKEEKNTDKSALTSMYLETTPSFISLKLQNTFEFSISILSTESQFDEPLKCILVLLSSVIMQVQISVCKQNVIQHFHRFIWCLSITIKILIKDVNLSSF